MSKLIDKIKEIKLNKKRHKEIVGALNAVKEEVADKNVKVTNPVEEVTVKNPVKEVEVSNFPKQKEFPKSIEVKKPKWLSFKGVEETMQDGFLAISKILVNILNKKPDLTEYTKNAKKSLYVTPVDKKGNLLAPMGGGGSSPAGVGSDDFAVKKVEIVTDGSEVDVQNPFSTDGDSIYIKDLIEEENLIGTFEGNNIDVSSLFDGFENGIVDTSNTNPKWFEFKLNRPQTTGAIGIVAETGNFSNVKILFKDRQDNILQEMDDSGTNTKYEAARYPVTAQNFCCVRIEFHTVDQVNVNFLRITKDVSTTARIKALKPDGTEVEVKATSGGNLKFSLEEFDDAFYDRPLPTADFFLSVAQGLVTGHSIVNKFGQNDDLNSSTYEDIWDGGGTYVYPADNTAPITKLVGHNSGDIESIEVQGLDINGILVIQTKTLTGLTAVTLDTPLWRVFRLKNVGTNDLIADVCAIDDGDTQDYACIDNGNNQTLMALYTIPAGKTGYLMQGTNNLSGVTRAVAASGKLWMRPFGLVFQLKKTFGVNSEGSSFISINNPLPGRIPEKTDIRVSALGSANGVSINTTFDILLIDNV